MSLAEGRSAEEGGDVGAFRSWRLVGGGGGGGGRVRVSVKKRVRGPPTVTSSCPPLSPAPPLVPVCILRPQSSAPPPTPPAPTFAFAPASPNSLTPQGAHSCLSEEGGAVRCPSSEPPLPHPHHTSLLPALPALIPPSSRFALPRLSTHLPIHSSAPLLRNLSPPLPLFPLPIKPGFSPPARLGVLLWPTKPRFLLVPALSGFRQASGLHYMALVEPFHRATPRLRVSCRDGLFW